MLDMQIAQHLGSAPKSMVCTRAPLIAPCQPCTWCSSFGPRMPGSQVGRLRTQTDPHSAPCRSRTSGKGHRCTVLYWLPFPARTSHRLFRPLLVLSLAGRLHTLHHLRRGFHHRHTERNCPCCLWLRFQQDSPRTSCYPLRVACPIRTRRILWIHPVGSCLMRTAGRFQCSVL